MSVTFSAVPKIMRWTLMCGLTAMALSAHAQRSQTSSEAVPSELLSDDERIDFCAQMHRASTPQERSAVAAHMRDTLVPRAKGQGVPLPGWVLEGRPANQSGSIPGLSCESGAARPRATGAAPTASPTAAQAATPAAAPAPVPAAPVPARQTPEHKPPPHEPVARAAPAYPAPVPALAAQNMPAPAEPAVDTAARSAVSGDIPVAHDHGIAYVTGGVGQDEVAAFRGLASGYNMRATFTTGSGEYLSGVAVQVARSDGTVVFNATSDGPYLYARLPQGHYRLTASLDGAQRSRDLYVPARGGVRFTLVWPKLSTGTSN
ncbi:MAG: carboxypeptidase-like regulatory domain-containing protein [Paraburkholderia sp.]|jgi:hypothetical protein|uniref:carboxypeptidase-like regulatory domain-containing protein n=1 Tax=Burkholderiaceae TaxID=119060 RepID=UPI001484E191|nr:carboxypeptidase-like regulatory domain-containing protein [Burkholderia sp. 4M9327F10]